MNSPRIICHGRAAEIFARRFPHDTAAVATDPAHAAQALADLARIRRAGTPILAALCYDDQQALIAEQAMYGILTEFDDDSRRRAAFEALAAGVLHFRSAPVREQQIFTLNQLRTAREFISMADGVLIRSTRERRLLEATFGISFRHAIIPTSPDPTLTVPADTTTMPGGDIVIYAPDIEGSALLTVLAGLPQAMPATIICRGRLSGTHHRFVPLEETRSALRSARVVIDTQIGDPGTAIALTGYDFGVVCARTCGADEFIDGIEMYNPGDPRTVTGALMRAAVAPRTHRRRFVALAETKVSEFIPTAPASPALVSIVVPTYNRPEYVRQTLENFSRQTYPRLEVIIVNDGGTPVDQIVAEYPFARSLTLPQNGGTSRAVNYGFARASGEYIGVVADDDVYYPTHVAYLVHALESSGLDIAHGNMINNLVVRGPGDTVLTTGYNLSHDGTIDPIEVYWAMRVASQSLLMRRSVRDECGMWSENYHVVTDHEFIIRVGLRYDFAHVPIVTNEMRIRNDGTTVSNRNTADYLTETQDLFASVAPPARQLIIERQAQTFEACRIAKTTRVEFYPCWTPLTEPLPL